MKKILIGDEFFDKTIFDQQWFYEEHPLLKKYQTIEIEDEYYIDCALDDFDVIDNAYVFNVEKYNARKQKELVEPRIAELKQLLAGYDYIGIKIATGRATREEYAEEISQMTEWANEINELEASL